MATGGRSNYRQVSNWAICCNAGALICLSANIGVIYLQTQKANETESLAWLVDESYIEIELDLEVF